MIIGQFIDTYTQRPIQNSPAVADILVLYTKGGRTRAVKSMLEGLRGSVCPIGDDTYVTHAGAFTFVCIDDIPNVVGTYSKIITLDIPCDFIEESVVDKLLIAGYPPNYHSVTSYTKD